ncbi:hypothetical protein LCGC14_2420540, partial [marine sediment metagenome]
MVGTANRPIYGSLALRATYGRFIHNLIVYYSGRVKPSPFAVSFSGSNTVDS